MLAIKNLLGQSLLDFVMEYQDEDLKIFLSGYLSSKVDQKKHSIKYRNFAMYGMLQSIDKFMKNFGIYIRND